MNKRIVICLIIIFSVILICVISNNSENNNKKISNNSTGDANSIKSTYNNETKMYEIIDTTTGEVITQTESEKAIDSELEFYKENPEYRANPPTSPEV